MAELWNRNVKGICKSWDCSKRTAKGYCQKRSCIVINRKPRLNEYYRAFGRMSAPRLYIYDVKNEQLGYCLEQHYEMLKHGLAFEDPMQEDSLLGHGVILEIDIPMPSELLDTYLMHDAVQKAAHKVFSEDQHVGDIIGLVQDGRGLRLRARLKPRYVDLIHNNGGG